MKKFTVPHLVAKLATALLWFVIGSAAVTVTIHFASRALLQRFPFPARVIEHRYVICSLGAKSGECQQVGDSVVGGEE